MRTNKNNCKTIKIFLASSEELTEERNAFGNLVRRLDDIYEKRGIRVKLFEWEDYDAAYNDRRKQEEYNEKVRESDLFLTIFYQKAGDFTIEEFNVATNHFKEYASPKVYIYCKDLQPNEEETPELKAFKKRLIDELGHYWCRFNNRDSMQLHFVMQLQLVESSSFDELRVESGDVKLGDWTIAKMDNLQFIVGNEEYQELNQRLLQLPEKIANVRLKLEKHPDDEDYKDDLQNFLDEYNALKERIEVEQKNIFNTSKQIALLYGQLITERMRRAMDAFQEGRVHEAKIILAEVEKDNDNSLQKFKSAKEILEKERTNLILSIEELQLKASIVLSDISITVDERINEAERLYTRADDCAQKIELKNEKYINLLEEYTDFLFTYAKYKKAIEKCKKLLDLRRIVYGVIHVKVADSYNLMGQISEATNDFKRSLEYYEESLKIYACVYGDNHPKIAVTNNNKGIVYEYLGEYSSAHECYSKSLKILKKAYGCENSLVASCYGNLGMLYHAEGEYYLALEYTEESLKMSIDIYGNKHPNTAIGYNNIGAIYDDMGDFRSANKYYEEALNIWIDIYGPHHPNVAISYNNIGSIFQSQKDYINALFYFEKSLEIRHKSFSEINDSVAECYNNIGGVYDKLGNHLDALNFYWKALDIWKKIYGLNHPSIADCYNNIGAVHASMNQYNSALRYFNQALIIILAVYDMDSPQYKRLIRNIEFVKAQMNEI